MSVIDHQHINQQIKEKLFEIAYKVECYNKTGDYDISRYAETYFKDILNIVFKREKWRFKKAEKINQETYDLYDAENRVCVQITSNGKASKKRKTIEQFQKKLDSREFNTLIIFFITKRKPNLVFSHLDSYTYNDFDVVEFSSLIEQRCKQSELVQIRDILFFDYKQSIVQDSGTQKKKGVDESEKVFLKNIELEKKLKAELLIPDYWKKIDNEILSKEPFRKFKDSRFILRSIDDNTYPGGGKDAKWERTFMYDFYDKGILVQIGAVIGFKAVIKSNDKWYIKNPLKREEKNPVNSREVNLIILGKLPYTNIVHYKDGDEYYNDYHLYCKYIGVDNSPYEEIVYFTDNWIGCYWIELDKAKKINL